MNNQQATFALKFVVENLSQMRKSIETMNNNIKKMQQNAKSASKGMDGLNNSFRKTIRSISKFALAYFAISKIMTTGFKKMNESLQIDMMAQSSGVLTSQIGKLGKALRSFGGDARSAGNAYASLTDIIGSAQHGMGVSEDVQRVNSRFGIAFNYGNITQDQLMTNIATRMKTLRQQGNAWGVNEIAKAYGFDEPMTNFLATYGSDWIKQRNSKEYKDLNKSGMQKLQEVEDKIDTSLAKIAEEILPPMAVALEKLVPLVQSIADIVGLKWWEKQGKKVGDFLYNSGILSKKTKYSEITVEEKKDFAKKLYNEGKIDSKKYYELMEAYNFPKRADDILKNSMIAYNGASENIKGVANGTTSASVKVEATTKVKIDNNTPYKASASTNTETKSVGATNVIGGNE